MATGANTWAGQTAQIGAIADNRILNGMNSQRYSGKKSAHEILMYIFHRAAVLGLEGKRHTLNAPVRWHYVAQINRLVVNLFTLAQMRQGHGGKWETYKELSQDLTSCSSPHNHMSKKGRGESKSDPFYNITIHCISSLHLTLQDTKTMCDRRHVI